MFWSRQLISVRSVSDLDKKKSWKDHLPTRRRLIQLYAALLYNANLKGFTEGQIYTGTTKNVCVPGLNCYSCPGAVGACPLGALQNAIASSNHRAPYYVLGMLMLFGLLLGRLICGFLCPFGLIQELLHKIPTPKLKKNRITRVLSWLKYVILAVFVILVPLMYSLQSFPVPAFCKYICPAGTLEGAVGLLANPVNADKFSMLGILFTRKYVILILILLLCIFCYRAFCRFLCPLGAIYGLFCRVALFGVRLDKSRCTDCGFCIRSCQMDIRHVGDHECIQCGACMKVCPVQAISWKKPLNTLMGFEKQTEACRMEEKESDGNLETGSAQANQAKKGGENVPQSPKFPWKPAAVWAVALAVLAGVLWYYNHSETPDPETIAEIQTSEPSAETAGEGLTETPDSETAESQSETSRESQPQNRAEESASDANAGNTADLETGKDVGMLCPDFTVPQYDGSEFHLADTRGKITVINFWATWCTPCCNELPYFDQLSANYPDTVSVIAIHSSLITDDVQAYLDKMEYQMPFALDETGDVIASLGGSTMLPMTVIVDQDGVIVYNQVGSVTYQMLESWVKKLSK